MRLNIPLAHLQFVRTQNDIKGTINWLLLLFFCVLFCFVNILLNKWQIKPFHRVKKDETPDRIGQKQKHVKYAYKEVVALNTFQI